MDDTRFAGPDCLHCGTTLVGEHCHVCGQRRARRLRFGALLREGWARLLDLDMRFPRTLVALVRDPGLLARRYVDGDRVGYSNPLFMLLVASTVYAFVMTALDVPIISPFGQAQGASRTAADAILAVIGYLLVFVLAPAAWVLARASRGAATTAEWYVLLVTVYSLHLLCGSLMGAAHLLDTAQGWNLLRVLQFGLIAWGIARFEGRFRAATLPLALIAMLVAMLGLMVFGTVMVTFGVFTGTIEMPRPG